MRKLFDKIKKETPGAIITADMSSSIASRDLTREDIWQDFGVIYAGAQKNLGTSGLTFVFIRDDVLELAAELRPLAKIPIPTMMDWTRQSKAADFFVNTPSMFSVYAS